MESFVACCLCTDVKLYFRLYQRVAITPHVKQLLATPGKPSGRMYFYTAYVLAVWVGIFMMDDVISESAPSKSAALGTSVVPSHTHT
jgi:hypothetical protein